MCNCSYFLSGYPVSRLRPRTRRITLEHPTVLFTVSLQLTQKLLSVKLVKLLIQPLELPNLLLRSISGGLLRTRSLLQSQALLFEGPDRRVVIRHSLQGALSDKTQDSEKAA